MYRAPGNGFGDNRQAATQGYGQVSVPAAGEWGGQTQQSAYQTQAAGWGYGAATQPAYTGQEQGNWTESSGNESRTFTNVGQGRSRFGGEGWGGGRGEAGSMVIEVPSQEIRRIIGRGGTKIRELEQGSGCRIKINKERDNGVTAGIELVGSELAQSTAQQMINDVVLSSQSSGFGNGQSGYGRSGFGGSRGFQGRSDFGSEGTLEMEIANRDVARVIGRGGSKIRELQDESSTRIQINKDRDNGVTTVVEIRGSEEGQQRAKQLIEELTASQNAYDEFGGRNGDMRQGRGGGGAGSFGGRSDWGGESLEMEVPSKDVARIIGKGGSKIQEMQDKSGTRIKINKDRDDGVTTVVEIRGSKEGQQKAKQLIEELG